MHQQFKSRFFSILFFGCVMILWKNLIIGGICVWMMKPFLIQLLRSIEMKKAIKSWKHRIQTKNQNSFDLIFSMLWFYVFSFEIILWFQDCLFPLGRCIIKQAFLQIELQVFHFYFYSLHFLYSLGSLRLLSKNVKAWSKMCLGNILCLNLCLFF